MQHPRDGGSHHRWQNYELIKQKVITILDKNPNGITGAQLARLVGITPGAMSKYLSMMSVDGIIVSRKVGVAKLWKLVSSSDRKDLLANKMGSGNLNFKDYVLSLVEKNHKLLDPENKQVLVIHSALLVNLYRYTGTILGSEAHAFFYEWGRSFTHDAKDLVEHVAEKTGNNILLSFLTLLELQGWGRFDIRSADPNSIEVVWFDSFWADEPNSVPADDFIVGALTEAASLTFGGNWRFTEVECRSMGAQTCRFVGSQLKMI